MGKFLRFIYIDLSSQHSEYPEYLYDILVTSCSMKSSFTTKYQYHDYYDQ